MIHLQACTTDDPAFQSLIRELDAEFVERYGEIQNQYSPYNVMPSDTPAVVAFDGGTPVGCGAFRVLDIATVEIKRMYVRPNWRGRGISRQVLHALEEQARRESFKVARLETGTLQPEAIALYESAGYGRIPCYGPYVDLPMSVCYEKALH